MWTILFVWILKLLSLVHVSNIHIKSELKRLETDSLNLHETEVKKIKMNNEREIRSEEDKDWLKESKRN